MINLRGTDSGALYGRARRMRTEVAQGNSPERSTELAEGRPGATRQNDIDGTILARSAGHEATSTIPGQQQPDETLACGIDVGFAAAHGLGQRRDELLVSTAAGANVVHRTLDDQPL